MQKAKLRIIEKHIEDCQLREILTMLLLPNRLSGNKITSF